MFEESPDVSENSLIKIYQFDIDSTQGIVKIFLWRLFESSSFVLVTHAIQFSKAFVCNECETSRWTSENLDWTRCGRSSVKLSLQTRRTKKLIQSNASSTHDWGNKNHAHYSNYVNANRMNRDERKKILKWRQDSLQTICDSSVLCIIHNFIKIIRLCVWCMEECNKNAFNSGFFPSRRI